MDALGQCEESVVWCGAEDVGCHIGDGGLIEAFEGRLVGPVAQQHGEDPAQVTVGLGGAESEHPADRQRRQAARKAAKRCGGAAVGPLQVVEADHDRLAKSSLLEERLDVLQQPVALLGRRVRIAEGRSLVELADEGELGVGGKIPLQVKGTCVQTARRTPRRLVDAAGRRRSPVRA